mmetsp:Transcript_90831/g.132843  ORF Transcript_90831/g.132843 Transcript_90831/m.132843 type:complete len:89 (-) Transcript_90831:133-399(-)
MHVCICKYVCMRVCVCVCICRYRHERKPINLLTSGPLAHLIASSLPFPAAIVERLERPRLPPDFTVLEECTVPPLAPEGVLAISAHGN